MFPYYDLKNIVAQNSKIILLQAKVEEHLELV